MNVLMVCSGGMSSGFIVKAIADEAKKQNFNLVIKAIGTSDVADELLNEKYDVILVAPQVQHRLKKVEEEANKYNICVEPINPQLYSPIRAGKIIEQIKKFL